MAPRGTTPGATAPTGIRTAATRDRASPPRVTAARAYDSSWVLRRRRVPGRLPPGTVLPPGGYDAPGRRGRPTVTQSGYASGYRRPAKRSVWMGVVLARVGIPSGGRVSVQGMITRRGLRAHTGGFPFSRCSTIRRRNSTGWRNAPPKEFARPSPTRWFMSSTWCPRRQCSGSSTRFTATARLLRAMSGSRIFSVSSPIAASCVLATNIIDLRLKYAKVAALAAAQAPEAAAAPGFGQETQLDRVPAGLGSGDRYATNGYPAANGQYQSSDRYAARPGQYGDGQYQAAEQYAAGSPAPRSTAPRRPVRGRQRPVRQRQSQRPAQQSRPAQQLAASTATGNMATGSTRRAVQQRAVQQRAVRQRAVQQRELRQRPVRSGRRRRTAGQRPVPGAWQRQAA